MSYPGQRETVRNPRRRGGFQTWQAVVIAVLGLVAAVLGLVPPILELMKDDEPGQANAVTSAATSAAPQPATSAAQPAQPATPPGTVATRFHGTWVGSIEQGNSPLSPYPVTITITGGPLGQRVGTSDYVTLDCGGHLVLASATDSQIVVQENLRTQGECLDKTQIILTANADGTLDYHIEAAGFFVSEATGTLHKQ